MKSVLPLFVFIFTATAQKDNTQISECILAGKDLPQSTEWKGTQKSYVEFSRLSPTAKSRLRSFELKQVEDLDVSDLLAQLRPCTTLESIRLINVELLGEFPNVTKQKLNLPNLREFHLKLSYPPVPIPSSLSSYFFYTKEEDTFESDVDIKVEVGGYTNFVVDHNFGEFLVGVNESAMVATFLSNVAASPVFRLRRLTLKATDVTGELIPPDLSFLQLMYNQVGSTPGSMETTYNEIIQKSTRLRSLHLAANEWELPLLDLTKFPKSLESLSLTNFRLNYTGKPTTFNRLKNFYLQNCIFEAPGIFKMIETIVPHPERFGVTFPDGSGVECYTLLQSILFSKYYPLYDNLDFIFIENCERSAEISAKFEMLETFFEGAGIEKDTPDFLLEKKDEWIGRGVDALEKRRIYYDFERWDKLESWVTFKNV